MTKYALKNDRFRKARGGTAQFLDLYCARCGAHLLLYQKDGPGSLHRLYLDRILAPHQLASPAQSLRCAKCAALLGTATIYQQEDRAAIRLVPGSFAKRRSRGVFPPDLRSLRDAAGGKNPDDTLA